MKERKKKERKKEKKERCIAYIVWDFSCLVSICRTLLGRNCFVDVILGWQRVVRVRKIWISDRFMFLVGIIPFPQEDSHL